MYYYSIMIFGEYQTKVNVMTILELLLGLIGSIISVLLIIVGFFLKQHIGVVRELTKSVNILSQMVAVLENNNKNMVLGCNSKHFIIDSRLTKHGERIDDIDVEIARIKERCKITEK